MGDLNQAAAMEDTLYAAHAEQIRAGQPAIAACITTVTGWQGVDNLASWVVDLLIANQGGSSMDGVRPPCQQSHAPQTMAEYEAMLRDYDWPEERVQQGLALHRASLLERFGI